VIVGAGEDVECVIAHGGVVSKVYVVAVAARVEVTPIGYVYHGYLDDQERRRGRGGVY